MRLIPTWKAYDRSAAAGDYGSPVDEAGNLVLSSDGKMEARFFQQALVDRICVLDLGCGPGLPLVTIAGSVGAVHGVDAAPAMLALARRNIRVLQIRNACLVCALAENLPYPDVSFDGVAVSGTLGSVPDPERVVTELARVAKPGAVVASLEQDFRGRLAEGAAREERWLLRDIAGGIVLRVVRYLVQPYRIREERYIIAPNSDFSDRLLLETRLEFSGRVTTDLRPEKIPDAALCDAFFEEEAQFDPASLRETFAQAGFVPVEQEVRMSYGVPHIFSVLQRRGLS